jgi:hypothetical protein
MNEEKMLACPFCGTLPKYGEKECHGSGKPMNAWWVMCPYCQATGPTRGNSIEAMLEWNKRVGVRPPATPEVEDVKALASATGSVALKREIRRAIHAIHEEDDYDKGMAILCKLAGIKVNAKKFIAATPAECVPPND